MTEKTEIVAENLEADIVVIGGGGAGLPAAVSAAESGAKNIIVLEKRKVLGGNANMAGGMFAVESPTQKRMGETFSRDQAFKEKMDYGHWTVDPRVVRTFINTTAEVVEWLENKGLIFNHATEFVVLGQGPKVYHQFCKGPDGKIGAKVMEKLSGICREKGIKIFTETPAGKIHTDEKGAVSAVIAGDDGGKYRINTRAAIIAAGDFPGNKELMDKYLPAKGFRLSLSLPHTGDGLIMAGELGAVVDDVVTQFFCGPHHYPYAPSLNQLLRRPEVMIVNIRGERFSDESLWLGKLHQTGNPLARQPDERCYALIDSAALKTLIAERTVYTGLDVAFGTDYFDEIYDDFEKDIPKGVAKKAGTLDEIAEFIGAKPEVLKATIDEYNSYCDKGYDYDFLKEKRFLYPVKTAPFYAILGRQGFDSTFGGIKINQRMEVINRQFDVIPGLYAAGNNAGSCVSPVYHARHAGTSLSFAICSGYLAGKSAAKYITGK